MLPGLPTQSPFVLQSGHSTPRLTPISNPLPAKGERRQDSPCIICCSEGCRWIHRSHCCSMSSHSGCCSSSSLHQSRYVNQALAHSLNPTYHSSWSSDRSYRWLAGNHLKNNLCCSNGCPEEISLNWLLRALQQWRCKYLGIGARAGHVVTFTAVSGTHCDLLIGQVKFGLS